MARGFITYWRSVDVARVRALLLLAVLASTSAFAALTTFFDDFNRPDSVTVGNDWQIMAGSVGGELIIQNNTLTTPVPGGAAGIWRPIDFSGPVTISGTLTQTTGADNSLKRYESGFWIGTTGSRAVPTGYEIIFLRSGGSYSNSGIELTFNGAVVAIIPSTFQYGAAIAVTVTYSPVDGRISGSVTGDVQTFAFDFGPGQKVVPGPNVGVGIDLEFRDGRAVVTVNPTFDNFSISYGDAAPPPPASLRGTPASQSVDLRWNSIAQPNVTGYNVYVRPTPSVPPLPGQDTFPAGWQFISSPSGIAGTTPVTTGGSGIWVDRIPTPSGAQPLQPFSSYDFAVTTVNNLGAEGLPSDLFTAKTGMITLGPRANPILFLHGIWSSAETSSHTRRHLETIGLKYGGEITLDALAFPNGCTALSCSRLCTLDDPCASVKANDTSCKQPSCQPDFYTSTFSNNNADYSNLGGITQQGKEVKASLDAIAPRKAAIVAHSMDGLAARSYIEGISIEGISAGKFNEDVSSLITYGTPHFGTPLTTLYADTLLRDFVASIATRFSFDLNGGAVRDMTPTPPSSFLTALNTTPLPPTIEYTSIISSGDNVFTPCGVPPAPSFPGLNQFIISSIGGPSDCMVPVASQDLTPRTAEIGRPIQLLYANRGHFSNASPEKQT